MGDPPALRTRNIIFRSPTSGTSRSSRCSTTRRATRHPSGRSCAPAPRRRRLARWVVQVDDISEQETRLGRESVLGNRHRPDGVELLGASSASRACRPTRSSPSSSSGRRVPHPPTTPTPRSPSTRCRSRATPSACVTGSAPADSTSSVIDFTFVSPRHARPDGGHLRHPERRRHDLSVRSGPLTPTTGAAAGCSSRRARSTAPSRRRSSGRAARPSRSGWPRRCSRTPSRGSA